MNKVGYKGKMAINPITNLWWRRRGLGTGLWEAAGLAEAPGTNDGLEGWASEVKSATICQIGRGQREKQARERERE